MHTTTDIHAVVTKAKQQRADFMAAKVQKGALPIAVAAVISLALVSLTAGPSQDQAEHPTVVDVSALNA